MAQEIIGTCELCRQPLTRIPNLGLCSVDTQVNPGWITYHGRCSGSPLGHLLMMSEEYLRARNLAIAEAHERELAEHSGHQAVMGEWHDGRCAGCGLETQVIGLPGAEFCTYCEELRTLTGPPENMLPPVRALPGKGRVLLGLSCIAASMILTFTTTGIFVPGLLVIWGLLLLRSAT